MVKLEVNKIVDKEDEWILKIFVTDLNIMANDSSTEKYTKDLTMSEYWNKLGMIQYWNDHIKGVKFPKHEIGRSGKYIVVRRKDLGHIVLTIQ